MAIALLILYSVAVATFVRTDNFPVSYTPHPAPRTPHPALYTPHPALRTPHHKNKYSVKHEYVRCYTMQEENYRA